ncbi:uncharacterized protein LOC133927351 isoform X2 [Phragmites australis]|uniref:uncharacterized protein LOC133927351 isoform X2 n=2 Tax=Phragmites australis TaxID=29695 RepID=UPI002D7661CB|nr:uncharacterized protein LOC133927351 isoform X2 [Phragmites australis]
MVANQIVFPTPLPAVYLPRRLSLSFPLSAAFPLHRTTTPTATPRASIDTGDHPTASADHPESGHYRFVEQRTMEGSFQLNPNASPFIPPSLSSFAYNAPETQAESSSKGYPSCGTFDPSQSEENDMDPLALAKLVFLMFPNVSTDFIDELLKANEFDMNLTIDMLHELNSQDMLHDDAELCLPTFPDVNDLHDGLGLPGGDNHHAEVSESSNNLNQALQYEKSATTSDVKSVVPKINSLHNVLGLPDDDKSVGTSVAK